MAGIRGKNTKPEKMVRGLLFAMGYRFRLHRRDLPGVPDIVLPGRKVAIFVHGCFWHQHSGCRLVKMPSTNAEFWKGKLEKNVERDRTHVAALLSKGWRVLIIWECATRDRNYVSGLGDLIQKWLEGDQPFGELPTLVTGTSRQP